MASSHADITSPTWLSALLATIGNLTVAPANGSNSGIDGDPPRPTAVVASDQPLAAHLSP
jgi:hypothetical protein